MRVDAILCTTGIETDLHVTGMHLYEFVISHAIPCVPWVSELVSHAVFILHMLIKVNELNHWNEIGSK